MKNVLIFASEVGSTKFIYNSIIEQNIFRFTFILSNNQNTNIYNDPRLHFVLVCGAISCPKIASFAYTPENLEAMLEERTKLALNNDEFIQVNDGNPLYFVGYAVLTALLAFAVHSYAAKRN